MDVGGCGGCGDGVIGKGDLVLVGVLIWVYEVGCWAFVLCT
jgi:hypothetical protein